MIVTKMTEEHLSGVLEIEEKSFTHPWSMGSFADELKKANSHKFVALEFDKVVGFAILETVLDEGNLLDIAVDTSCRRKGIGKALMDELFSVADAQKLSFVTLEVRASSEAAISLYKHCGFETVGVRKNYYSKPLEDAVLMTKYF